MPAPLAAGRAIGPSTRGTRGGSRVGRGPSIGESMRRAVDGSTTWPGALCGSVSRRGAVLEADGDEVARGGTRACGRRER